MIFHNMLVCVILFRYDPFGFWMFLKFHFRLEMVQSIIHWSISIFSNEYVKIMLWL